MQLNLLEGLGFPTNVKAKNRKKGKYTSDVLNVGGELLDCVVPTNCITPIPPDPSAHRTLAPAGSFLEIYESGRLINPAFQSSLLNHSRRILFRFEPIDPQQSTELIETNVFVNLTCRSQVVLQHSV